jgi:hypothetical protein
MKKISLNSIVQRRNLMKQEYEDFDLQHEEYTRMYFNRVYTEQLWMNSIYIDFDKLNFQNYPKVWTEKKSAKIDNLYNELEESPVIFKKYLNKLLRDDPINNVYLLTQHLDQLNKKIDDNNYEDEHLLQHIIQYRDLVSEILLKIVYGIPSNLIFPL